jgi:hypothetical protein
MSAFAGYGRPEALPSGFLGSNKTASDSFTFPSPEVRDFQNPADIIPISYFPTFLPISLSTSFKRLFSAGHDTAAARGATSVK